MPGPDVISIHAPRGRSDAYFCFPKQVAEKFQSTLLAGGATHPDQAFPSFVSISIHAPRGRSDVIQGPFTWTYPIFQSTLLAGGATRRAQFCNSVLRISIHAPRGRSDAQGLYIRARLDDFNPCSSREERQLMGYSPVEGGDISIHAPRGRSDPKHTSCSSLFQTFQSTLLAGGATSNDSLSHMSQIFQSTLLAGGATLTNTPEKHIKDISIHAPRGRSDHSHTSGDRKTKNFNPRSSREERQRSVVGGCPRTPTC